MKFINFLIVIFITLTSAIKADLNENLVKELKERGKIIFIRHAYAPGVGDPQNFKLSDCNTQRNLNDIGKKQAKEIGNFFLKNEIPIYKVISSEWCRCKETANLAFKNFETKDFLNSFYDLKFTKNKTQQIKDLKKYINNFKSEKNLVLVTHYVVILEALNYASLSGEIVISDKNLNLIGSYKTQY
jgi:phosphohistidine phosphatase SixA